MSAARVPRWALSFADLCLLLLAFFVLLQADRSNRAQLAAGIRAAFSGGGAPAIRVQALAASTMFEPGEAMLLAPARARLAAIGRAAFRARAGVRIESVGSDRAAARFDGWELAAARAAAVARGIAAGGEPAAAIDVAIPATTAAGLPTGQRLTIAIQPAMPSRR